MIVYQGHEGAYSHLACKHVFPEKDARACESFHRAMLEVEAGKASMAMIPVDNSTAGRVEEIYRLLPEMSLNIVAEHFEAVNHCLVGLPGSSIKQITAVHSHPQALAQCKDNINSRGLQAIANLDTAGAALEVSQKGDPNHAAISSRLAAELYGLEILAENFQDKIGNTTRFIILSHGEQIPPLEAGVEYITSLLFKTRNIPASLYKALGGFATNGVNLVKLESYMPGGSLTASQFHVDIEGHLQSDSLKLALEELNFFVDEARLLGTYRSHPYRSGRMNRTD